MWVIPSYDLWVPYQIKRMKGERQLSDDILPSLALGLLGLLETGIGVNTAMNITMSSLTRWTVASNQKPMGASPSYSYPLSDTLLHSWERQTNTTCFPNQMPHTKLQMAWYPEQKEGTVFTRLTPFLSCYFLYFLKQHSYSLCVKGSILVLYIYWAFWSLQLMFEIGLIIIHISDKEGSRHRLELGKLVGHSASKC